MKINLGKLDSTIEKLQALRRLAADPDVAPFVTLTGRRSNAVIASGTLEIGNGRRKRIGGLKDTVLAACKEFGTGPFTARNVFEYLGTQENPPTNEKSVANTLRILHAEGKVRIVTEGSGRKATEYAA